MTDPSGHTAAIRAAESRGYAKGYAAGKRRADADEAALGKLDRENRFWREVFCAALNGAMISGKWHPDGNLWKSTDEHIKGAGRIADAALKTHGRRA